MADRAQPANRNANPANADQLNANPLDAAIPADLRDKLKIPAPSRYDGRRDPDTIRSWLLEMSNYASFHGLTPPQRIAIVPFYLSGPAATWWTALRANDEVPLGWGGVEDAFKKEFLPKNHISRLRTQLTDLKQTTSVAAYSAAFRQILLSLPKMDPDWVLHLYIQGLKTETRLDVEQKDPESLNDAEAHALRVDDIRFSHPNRQQNPGQRNGNKNGNKPTVSAIDTNNNRNRLAKLTDAERQRLKAQGACFKCRQPGHLAKDCTNRTSASNNGQNGHHPSRRPLQVAAVDVATATQPENGQR